MSEPLSCRISARTRFVAVLGWPIRHSASPAMHNAALAEMHLDWKYLALAAEPEHLRQAIAGAKAMRFVGLNLTVPHKLIALDCMDVLDESAKLWGAVNTVVFETCDPSGEWRPIGTLPDGMDEGPVRARGCNTDADAIVRSLREDLAIEPRGARLLLLGAGGAARAAALRLADEGVGTLWIVNRTESKAEELAAEVSDRFPASDVRVGYPDGGVEIVLNATSVGLKPQDGLPLDVSMFPLERADAVYDMIYRPASTPLLESARLAGCKTANGLGMLLHQGAAALELWSQRPVPVAVMRAALEREIHA